MSCRYCFVPKLSDILKFSEQLIILEKLSSYFRRVNFVGGEPTLSNSLIPLVDKANRLNMKSSIVTNGYRMARSKSFRDELIPKLNIIGLSVDSLKEETNLKIGRHNNEQVISTNDYLELSKQINDSEKILKINTVVSKSNLEEDFNDFYSKSNPDKIKLFQVLKPNVCLKHNYDNMLISDKEFNSFKKRHLKFNSIIFSENNEDMESSYFILNSDGCFLDNVSGLKSPSLLEPEMSVEKALKFINVNIDKYTKRYEKGNIENGK
jgi:radical S-adenosyl methionine domain-containing protein 2